MHSQPLFLGIDIGSTTLKGVVLNADKRILFSRYARHFSEVRQATACMIDEILMQFPHKTWKIVLSGSGALSLSEELGLPFVQEVVSSTLSIRQYIPDTDVAVELGGEDAKLTYFTGGIDQRMNETCAGGTGAFIDQMAAFIQTDIEELDILAQAHSTIYPIASRCGVFSKTDILPLLNDGCAREDIAASIMQAVVNQTIGGLARGREIKGKVVFLGGPLTFLKSLRERFVQTLNLSPENAVFPEHAEYFVALGAALYAQKERAHGKHNLETVADKLRTAPPQALSGHLPPLFRSPEERRAFEERHALEKAKSYPLEAYRGKCWLGIDSGSTTIKAVLIDPDGRILYSHYENSKGTPLQAALEIVRDIYNRKHPDATLCAAAATGYGSALLTAGLGADIDEVETIAHQTAADFFLPDVDYILDIGGQDIKCMQIRLGAIRSIQLNEACSAGCGSFIETFARSLNIPLEEFVEAALQAEKPVDLGTRCTVFMNSKVKQAQKEGASIGDIAAGLCYSVVRNACQKVMKVTNPGDLGEHIVVQGGAFLNDALLRAMEIQLGKGIVRPDIAGLMGAFGAALIAKERGALEGQSRLLSPKEALSFRSQTAVTRCGQCTNRCQLTVTVFQNGKKYISGNRCERGKGSALLDLPNMYAYKYRRLFKTYTPLTPENARRGTVGIPRTLNIFENYPLWFTLFTELGFRVELSAPSSKELFLKGHGTIPSQTVCYPAKLAHGHVMDLIEKGIKTIFFPCLPLEGKECDTQSNSYNCPVVTSYPELLEKNVGELETNGVHFIQDFLPLCKELLATRLKDIPFFWNIPFVEIERAVRLGFEEMERYKADIRRAGEKALKKLAVENRFGIVLSGHPYHTDPEVHHGIPELITSCGMGVLSEDSVAHLVSDPGPMRVVNQWTYHARLYRAGAFVGQADNLSLLQLISFGCGLDAITSDQLEEIVTSKGRLYAQIKIDEGAHLGPARIRIRSLLATMLKQQKALPVAAAPRPQQQAPVFSPDMRETHTILIPQLSPIHFQFVETIFASEGYRVCQLPTVNRQAIELGLSYVNNDACFPSIVLIGQLLQALKTGRHNPYQTALMISQTGGGCRATNYIAFLRKALADCGLEHIPVVTFNMDQTAASGLKLPVRLLRKAVMAGFYGDLLMRLLYRVMPYELETGSSSFLAAEWARRCKQQLLTGNIFKYEANIISMIRDFDRLPLYTEGRKPRVGIVGEILLKYHPDANNNAAELIMAEGGEPVVPDLMDFALYSCYDPVFKHNHLSGSLKNKLYGLAGIAFLEFCRWGMRLALSKSKRFSPPLRFSQLKEKVKGLVSLGHQTGEGWLLVAEMIELIESGASNILCLQPFGCLPNHIIGKGLIREIKRRFPSANILPLDYDPGASETNQINRIKLMMSAAQ